MYHFRPVARDTARLILLTHHKAGDILQKYQGCFALGTKLYEVGPLDGRLAEQDAVVGDNTYRVAVNARKAADKGLAV